MLKKAINLLISLFFIFALITPASSAQGDYSIKEVKDENLFSLECRDVDIKDILRAIAKENNLNLIISDDITAKVTLSFDRISLNDALEAILRSNKLDYIIKNDIMRVAREEDLIGKEELKKKEEEKEYVTKVINLSYADAGELKNTIEGSVSKNAMISSDKRTNSLLINVEKKDVENIKSIIKELDTQTKQIMIKAKIVETTADFSKELGVQWGGNYYRDTPFNNGISSTGFPNTLNVAGSSGSGTYAVNLPAVTPTAGIGINLGSIDEAINLDLRLSAMEKTGKVHVISKPHITTLNNKPAKIHSGITFRVRTTAELTTGSRATEEEFLEEIKAGIDLVVTPRISYNNLIELSIDVTKSEPDFTKVVDGIPGIIDKNANTTVLVKNGESAVIGGLKRDAKNDVDNSVPFFSKIPVLGWFFKSKSTVNTNEDLLIFITPVLIDKNSANISLSQDD